MYLVFIVTVDHPPSPQYRRWFLSPECGFLGYYMNPYPRFLILTFFASRESGGIGEGDFIMEGWHLIC